MFKSFNIKQTIAFGLLCLIVVGCSSYTPYRYSFSLIQPRNETLGVVDSDVEFKFVPSSENIQVSITNKTHHEISLVRDEAEYIDPEGKSRMVHYGSDYTDEVLNFTRDNKYVSPMKIGPDSEITGYVWINMWPDFCVGEGRAAHTDAQINYLKEPFFPRRSSDGSVKGLKSSTFNLVLPIDFGEYERDYTFTFMIDDVI